MSKMTAALPMLMLGALLAVPVAAKDLDGLGGPSMKRGPDLQVRPRGQREQVVPPGDAYSTEEPDADDDDLDNPNEAPADRRL